MKTFVLIAAICGLAFTMPAPSATSAVASATIEDVNTVLLPSTNDTGHPLVARGLADTGVGALCSPHTVHCDYLCLADTYVDTEAAADCEFYCGGDPRVPSCTVVRKELRHKHEKKEKELKKVYKDFKHNKPRCKGSKSEKKECKKKHKQRAKELKKVWKDYDDDDYEDEFRAVYDYQWQMHSKEVPDDTIRLHHYMIGHPGAPLPSVLPDFDRHGDA